jgi:hypothetical protein
MKVLKSRRNFYSLRLATPLTMSAIPRTDYLKILVLFSLLGICIYSALQKFLFVEGPEMRTLEVDFSICNKYGSDGNKADPALLAGCKEVVTAAYANAQQMCKGYIHQLSTCMQGRKPRCQNEHTNVEGCVNAILKSAIDNWK